ncbi:hypothetical protein E5676_scaffold347G00310 [Cucumis melo var. makuwa]|uniref:Uncharacterized protein n=1 Tax=Cucumis melo var. makuwa TaxID=1194695 RepID=A0A5D3C0G3_CUCMM|nr:hypothetical protein E6C27_scaffold481G00220 [Cucumis melo var. makuwa]TYK03839.1 hypothetical protein E5676_scaffold347G00310 [Cucumis melo var. makuwa]
MSALDNGRGNLEFLWGSGLDEDRRTAIEDGITIWLYFQLDGKMMGWWRKILSWFIILAGLMGTEVLEKEWIRGVLTFVRMGSGKWHLESLMGGLMMPSTPLDLQIMVVRRFIAVVPCFNYSTPYCSNFEYVSASVIEYGVSSLMMTKMVCSILRRRCRKLVFGGTHDAISPAQHAANQIRKVASHFSGDNISSYCD